MSRVMVLICLLLFAGCAEPDEPAPYKSIVDTKQLMNWILDPNADVIWDSAGFEVTAEGTRNLAPTTEEGWIAVRNSAATIAEVSNLLMMPGRARDGTDWMNFSQGMQMSAVQLIDAADHQDAKGVFDYGGRLFTFCISCHQLYMLQDPSPSQ